MLPKGFLHKVSITTSTQVYEGQVCEFDGLRDTMITNIYDCNDYRSLLTIATG